MNEWRKPFLSEEQLLFFKEQGYIIIPNSISEEKRTKLVDEIWAFSQLDPKLPKSWYSSSTTLQRNGFLEMYHNPIQWEIRTDPNIYNIFADLLECEHLWVSIDRVCLKLPSKLQFTSRGFYHWDYDVWGATQQLQLQGLIALEDTTKEMGGFHCAPGMHKWIVDWAENHSISMAQREKFIKKGIPINVPNRYERELKKFDKPIEMKAGDLVIWRGELAHGNGENSSTIPRLAMYLSMFPSDPSQHNWISDNIRTWSNSLPGFQSPYPQIGWGNTENRPGDKRKTEQAKRTPVDLTELGERLVGIQPWE